jgi:sulfite exporter TauE/SafE
MTEHLQMLATLCGPDGPGGPASVMLALFLAGLVGSIAHCAPMCGPFVLAQVSGALQRIDASRLCERQRLTTGLLLPYHAGRLATYALLGAIAAGSGGILERIPGAHYLPAALLALAALLFIGQALRHYAPGLRLAPWSGQGPVPWSASVARWARRIDRTRPRGGLMLGLVLGLLPCGFLYAALAVAAATGIAWQGALAMVAFGAGTAPSLMVLGVAGRAGSRRWSRAMAGIGPVLMLFNATVLLLLAWIQLSN